MSAATIVSTGVVTGSSSWGTDKPKTASIPMLANDQLVVIAIGADYGGATDDFATPTGGSITYTLRQQQQILLNSFPWGWTGQTGVDQTVTLSVDVPAGAPRYGAVWAVVRGSAGYDSSAKANGTAASSISITTLTDNCCLIMGLGDWDAVDGAARVYRTVNGITPVAGGAGEISYQRTAGEYTSYGAVWSDAGAAGSKTVGLSAPAGGTVKWAGVVIAMKGSAGGSVVTGTAAAALGALTATATGLRTVHGTLTAPLGALTATVTGKRTVNATAAANLGALTATATGARTVHATATAALAALTGTLQGKRTVYGALAAALAALTATASQVGTVHGTAAAALGGLTARITVGAGVVPGVLVASGTSTGLTAGGTSTILTAAGATPGLTASGTP